MNLVFTSDLSGLGGGEVGLVYLVEELAKSHQCLIVCKTEGKLVDVLKEKQISVLVCDYKNKEKLISTLMYLRKRMKQFKPDAIFSNDPTTSILMKIATARMDCNNYWICHGQWYKFGYGKKLLLKHSNSKIICVSNAVKRNLEEQGFNQLETIYLGAPLNRFNLKTSLSFRKELGIELGVPLVITVARFQEIKGQKRGVEVAELLQKHNIPFVYAFIGGSVFGNDSDAAYEDEVKRLAKDKDLFNKRVFFVGERDDVANIMREADLLIIPSENESFGVVAIEALAAGLPIVSTPNDGVVEILENDKRFIAASRDPQDLFYLAQNLLSDDELRRRVGQEMLVLSNKFKVENTSNAFVEAIK